MGGKRFWAAGAAVVALSICSAAYPMAVDDKTIQPGKDQMTPLELAILGQLNVWMDRYDHDPGKMCQLSYTDDANVWVPNNGTWYRTPATWQKYEEFNFTRAGGKRNTHLKLAYVRDSVAVIEATGWAATLYFDPVTQRIFMDRTYITGRAAPAKVADIDAAPLISAGSVPSVIPDKTNPRYGAIEERASMKSGLVRTRALGLKVLGAGSLTDEETRNVETIRRMAELYNTGNPEAAIDAGYAKTFERTLIKAGPGLMEKDRKTLKALNTGMRKAFPDSRMVLTAIIPRGDRVAYETSTVFNKDHEEWSLTVATMKAGKIVEEHVYESTAYDPASDLGKLYAAAAVPLPAPPRPAGAPGPAPRPVAG